MQLKAIFSVLLRDYTFALAQPSDTYRNDHSKMVVQLEQPCAVTVRPRACRMKIVVDRDLCQGHAMCEVEAPEVFVSPKAGHGRRPLTDPAGRARRCGAPRRAVLPDPRPVDRGGLRWLTAPRWKRSGSAGSTPTKAAKASGLVRPRGLLRGRRDVRLELRRRTTTSWPSAATQIRELALGLEMQGLDGWTYPYQATVIDDQAGMVIGFWKQVADVTRPDGGPYEVAGFGCSWFGYADGAGSGSATSSTT